MTRSATTVRRRLALVVEAAACVGLLGVSGVAAAIPANPWGRAPSGSDARFAAVMGYHLQQEGSLAQLASSGSPDPAFATLAANLARQANAEADVFNQQLIRWSITSTATVVLREEATGTTKAPSEAVLHLSCSLEGPTSDADRLRAAAPADLAATFAETELTAALEGEQLVEAATEGGPLAAPLDSIAAATARWHQTTIHQISPYLLATDRAFAASFTPRTSSAGRTAARA